MSFTDPGDQAESSLQRRCNNLRTNAVRLATSSEHYTSQRDRPVWLAPEVFKSERKMYFALINGLILQSIKSSSIQEQNAWAPKYLEMAPKTSEFSTKANFDLIIIQKYANNWLKREFYCEETAFLIYEKERRRFVCQFEKAEFNLHKPQSATRYGRLCVTDSHSVQSASRYVRQHGTVSHPVYNEESTCCMRICGSRDLGPAYIDAGPSSSWYSSFDDKNSLEFKELPVNLQLSCRDSRITSAEADINRFQTVIDIDARASLQKIHILATNISTIFNPIDVTIRPISLYALRCPTVISRNMSNNSESSSSSNLNLLAICCIAHSEPRSLICCRSKDTIRQVSGGSLDNFLRTMSSILSISMSMDKQKILTRQNECLLTTAQVVFSNLG
uniref:Uncharacterized protein n=1 Tax=Romanomermis culicivorax TaxID=13658 RepID=A0A915KLN1_ROMCU